MWCLVNILYSMLAVDQKTRPRMQALEGLLTFHSQKKMLMAVICVTNLKNCPRDAGHWSHESWGQSENDSAEP